MKVWFGSNDEGKKFLEQFSHLPVAEAPQHNLFSKVQSPFKHGRERNMMAGKNPRKGF